MNLSLREDRELSIYKKFDIWIFKHEAYQTNKVNLPSKMNLGEVASFLEVLDILKISYKIEGQTLEIAPEQDPALELADQTKVYQWALENKFFPYIYSSYTSEEDETKSVSLSESLFTYLKFTGKTPKRKKQVHIKIEKYWGDPEARVNENDIIEIESFMQDRGIKLNNRVWKVDYYGVDEQHKVDSEPKSNTTIIDE